jgi:dTDP-4-dehydrorhamnose 3,5-epimerase
MIFTETKLAGAFILDVERFQDSRGFFTRTFDRKDFTALGLNPHIAQSNFAFNIKKGTVRGIHFQYPPFAEVKLVRCTQGAILDVIVDLRPESPTYLEHVAVELTEHNNRLIYVPERFGHSYQTLIDGTEASYDISEFYAPQAACSLLYSDPRFKISWPLPVSEISEKDRNARSFDEVEEELTRRMMVREDVNSRLDEIQPHYIR